MYFVFRYQDWFTIKTTCLRSLGWSYWLNFTVLFSATIYMPSNRVALRKYNPYNCCNLAHAFSSRSLIRIIYRLNGHCRFSPWPLLLFESCRHIVMVTISGSRIRDFLWGYTLVEVLYKVLVLFTNIKCGFFFLSCMVAFRYYTI